MILTFEKGKGPSQFTESGILSSSSWGSFSESREGPSTRKRRVLFGKGSLLLINPPVNTKRELLPH